MNLLYNMSIPKHIYFCVKEINPLVEKYANHWKTLNPEYTIHIYDDAMCEAFIFEHFGKKHKTIFRFIRNGPIKADFWRVCMLYIHGGVYSDIDNQPFVPIKDFIEEDIDFLTCISWGWKKHHFNPNLIFCKKGNSIMKDCIDWYISQYEDQKVNKSFYSYWGWSIMNAFQHTLHIKDFKREDGVYDHEGMKIQLLLEKNHSNYYKVSNIYKGKTIFNNRYEQWDWRNQTFKS